MISPCSLEILVEKSLRSLEAQAQEGRNKNLTGKCPIMMIPIRCFTCGKLIGDKWEEFARRVKDGEKPRKVLDELGITRYCCRRMLLSNVEIIDEVLKYYEEVQKRK